MKYAWRDLTLPGTYIWMVFQYLRRFIVRLRGGLTFQEFYGTLSNKILSDKVDKILAW